LSRYKNNYVPNYLIGSEAMFSQLKNVNTYFSIGNSSKFNWRYLKKKLELKYTFIIINYDNYFLSI